MTGAHKPWRRPWWLSFLDRTNLTVISLTACCLAYMRSVGVAYFGAGAIMCSLTVKIVKKFLKHPRPDPVEASRRKSTYGMPSTHSAAITYYATYIPLACLYLPIHSSLPDQRLLIRVLPPLIVTPWGSLIAVSRIWLGHHTWPQVAVGCSYGFAFACIWFSAWVHGLADHGQLLEQYLDSWFNWR